MPKSVPSAHSTQPRAPKPRSAEQLTADVLIIGGGPAGSSAAYHCAAQGLDTLVVDFADMLEHPRDKTCGDGLTPRAVTALQDMGAGHILAHRPAIEGLKLHGFGGSVTVPWPKQNRFAPQGSAIARTELDTALLAHAVASGARFRGGLRAVAAHTNKLRPSSVTNVRCVDTLAGEHPVDIRARWVLLAEGVRSRIARQLGVYWLRGMVHGVAARSYIRTPRGGEPWIHTDVELRDGQDQVQPGYGWVFPLGGDRANLGCGALATDRYPVQVGTKRLLHTYAEQVQGYWHHSGPTEITSALLPMGGAVTRVAGANWAALGDTAALVNPLNGEGIDYALESGRLVAQAIGEAGPTGRRGAGGSLSRLWPDLLRSEYGHAFSIARRLAVLIAVPGLLPSFGPLAMRGPTAAPVMGVAVRFMGNLVTAEDRDVAARVFRAAGRVSGVWDRVAAAESRPLFG
ncbi:geranylgeranyl reductase family protein [Corynebacterium heidelbergense]|uniref:FAD-linked oxidoreductase n=1 Tax=Corynebacterium heidelbergense TaxID=2055947 RepID=A0A364V6H2_9CORY|nr:geranylgeranyl reductase family protein [Corynebacterium heidelbergense]RAV32208.1 FAD-linked oxidoreductase [Corynebacterium heidelbergense]